MLPIILVSRGSSPCVTPAAASWGRRAVVELLIERGADVGIRNRAGFTALHGAETNGFAEIAAMLRARGAR